MKLSTTSSVVLLIHLRFLANKCSIASRIDSFSDAPTTRFGEALKAQVEERIQFYSTGTAPMKNNDAMVRYSPNSIEMISANVMFEL